MINGIYAAEFDIIKGCIITGSFPDEVSEESALASSMIPDGVHKVDKDKFFFKMGPTYLKPGKVKTYHFEHTWVPLFKGEAQNLTYVDQNTIKITTNLQDEWLDINLSNSLISRVGSKFVAIKVNPELRYGICGEVQEDFYLAVIKNKRDPSIKRGSLIRSIAIKANTNLFLGIADQPIEQALEEYFKLIGVEHWENQELKAQNRVRINALLQETMGKLLSEQRPQFYRFSSKLIDHHQKDLPIYYKKRLEGLTQSASVVELIKQFKMKVRIIYRAILSQMRVILLSHECSNSEKQKRDEIYSKQCSLACSLQFLVYPMNIREHIQGYKSLMDPYWDKKNSWITIVSNPIFEYRREWWDLFVDLASNKVVESLPPEQSLFINNEQDIEFFQNLVNLVTEQHINENQTRSILYKYTQGILKKEKMIQLKLYDEYSKFKLKSFFTEKQTNLFIKTLDILQAEKEVEDSHLLNFYLLFIYHAKGEKEFKTLIKLILQKGHSLNLLGVGRLSAEEQIRSQCKECLGVVEKFDKQLIRKINVMIIV